MEQLISWSHYIHPRKLVVSILKISDQKKFVYKKLVAHLNSNLKYVINSSFFYKRSKFGRVFNDFILLSKYILNSLLMSK